MKTIKRIEFANGISRYGLLSLLFAVSIGCSDDETKKKEEAGISEVTLNGGPYSNVTAKTTDEATAVYDPQGDLTGITYTTEVDGQSIHVIIAYPGNGTGQQAWNEEDCFVHTLHEVDDDQSITGTYIQESGDVQPGHVKIDNYGNVGGVVSGSFQGEATFIDTECNCMTTGTVKGTFRARRLQ